ncbi:MAG: 30S ribosomal protein S17 [Desulfovibrionaceae bacterium]|jgi:small subunit ribosomal protein S17|nr:30S ribosomal protein S17 [Desulfovibrionaceae bacterium]
MSEALESLKGRMLIGEVVSDKNDKTIVVRVQTLVKHPLLKKYVRRRKKFTAHDPMNECGIGDRVKIVEYRPLSRNKRWHLVSIIEKAK